MIPLTRPSIGEDDLEAVASVLRSGQLVQGPSVARFEERIAAYVGAYHAVAVSSCTAALQMSLMALNIGPGDLVIVGAYSWPATANVVELCGAKPIFVDIDQDTFNINPDALAETLARLFRSPDVRRQVKAIIPIHVFGQMADMPRLTEIAERYGVPIIEDAACALGASMAGRQAGTWGHVGCFSFHPRKAITTGEGGAIVTNDARVARYVRALRNHGQDVAPDTPDPFLLPGFNNRMTEFQAALGITQIAKMDRIISARRILARRYDTILSDAFCRSGSRAPDPAHVFQSYVVLIPAEAAPSRAELIRSLRAQGIETQIGTWHMPMITYYRSKYNFRIGEFPVCDEIARRALTLPLYEGLSETEQDKVAQAAHRTLSEVSSGTAVTNAPAGSRPVK